MFKSFFWPARKVMNQFTIPAKFFLVSMLFAVPLTITSLQSVLDSNNQLRSIKVKYTGSQALYDFLNVIEALETMRDLGVAQRFHSSTLVDNKFTDAKKQALIEIDKFIGSKQASGNQLIRLSIFSLKRAVQSLNVTSGTEADLENSIFEKVNLLVNAAYLVQSEIANINGLVGDRDLLANHLVTILTIEMQSPAEVMGEARSYGTSFITGQLISSYGIKLINDTLSKLKDSETHLRDRFTVLFSSYPEINNSLIIDPIAINELGELFLIIDDHILLDPDLTTPLNEFWHASTQTINKFSQFRRQIILFLQQHYDNEKKKMQQERHTFAIGIGMLICIFLYLFIGFYLAVKDSLSTLSRAAVQVASGSLADAVELNTKDELNDLASLFDKMRIQLKERQEQLVEITITDALTGVRNRKFFNDTLKESVSLCRRTDQPTSLLLMDIDHFKSVNDTFGHTAGDKCLQMVAQTLQENLSRPSDIVARYGGEEFAVLLPATDEKGASKIADKLCHSIRTLLVVVEDEDNQEQHIDITISIGVACSDAIANCEEELLVNQADNALYKAKESGRDRWVSAHE